MRVFGLDIKPHRFWNEPYRNTCEDWVNEYKKT